MDEYESYEMCWTTGNYVDQNCERCPYASECSGYTGDNFDDED